MAAKDYVFQTGCFGTIYLAKKIKSKTVMSQDRRPLTESECIGIFESYLRDWCEKNKEKTLVITSGDKVVFEATLVDKSKADYKNENADEVFEKELEAVDADYHGLCSLTDSDVENIARRFYNLGMESCNRKPKEEIGDK